MLLAFAMVPAVLPDAATWQSPFSTLFVPGAEFVLSNAAHAQRSLARVCATPRFPGRRRFPDTRRQRGRARLTG